MVLIVTNNSCQIVNYVCDYLISSNQKFLRINSEDNVVINWMNLDDSSFTVKGNTYLVSQFNGVWFYRGKLKLTYNYTEKGLPQEINEDIESHLNAEMVQIEYLFVSNFKGNILGNYYIPNSNKIKSLKLSKQYGLAIPETTILSTKKDLEILLYKHDKIITKGIQDSVSLGYKLGSNYINFGVLAP